MKKKPMCNFKTLYYASEGYLIMCSDCQHFQLAFQTTLLTMTAQDLQVFHTLVKENREYNPADINPERKNIYIPTPLEGYGIILNRKELEALFQLLETAEVNLKTASLLELFKTSRSSKTNDWGNTPA
ncbi:hypothetical protein LL912_18620 [Niabella sp. CC-SYL272]|uniref:DUF6686 family protein n=1 Tax=Niabella agricola TaxID=2891571 RepID=UPI001F2F1E21|nr:DUF6686 family protein [Niabella agricola]MCF3110805.1 hypothetical protein [Niabella agricola]